MATLWTLKYNGVEKALADWGILSDYSGELVNKAKSTVTLRTTERFDAGATQFVSFPAWFRANPTGSPASQLVIIYRDRTAVGSGGTIWFTGFFDDPVRLNSGGKENVQYQLHDVLWLFERNQFKQHRKQFNGWVTPGDPSSGAALVDKVCSEVFLGEKLDGTLWTNGEQIAEIINWINESYNPTKRGASSGRDDTKDVVALGTINPAALCAKTRLNTIFCDEAINNVLRWAPDAVFKVDHTTTPPTLNVLTMGQWNYATNPPTFIGYANLPEVVINITEDQEKEIQLQTNYGRTLPGVIIYYLSTATVDSLTVPVITRDAYPPSVDDFYPEVSSHAVQLEGSKLIHVQANIEVNHNTGPIADVMSATAATRKAWWKAHNAALKNDKILDGSIGVLELPPAGSGIYATVKDHSGLGINLSDYPNEVFNDIPAWLKTQFGIRVIEAFVSADIAYTQFTEAGHTNKDHVKDRHFTTKKVKLTNAVTKLYEAVQTFDSGEIPPQGVAESVYRGVAAAQNSGTITFVNSQLRSDIYIGCRLKLVGPTTTFDNILPQSIKPRPCQASTMVTFGPSATVDADALLELARATRMRFIYNMPSGRADGLGSGGDKVDHTMESASDDTAAGVGGAKFSAVTFTP